LFPIILSQYIYSVNYLVRLSENGIHFYAGMTIREFIVCQDLFVSQHTPTVVPDLIGNPTNTAGKKMGLPRLIGKALNNRTIYLYRPDSMAGLVLWIPVFTGKTIPGVFGQPQDRSKGRI
jgi:hypothetical protein